MFSHPRSRLRHVLFLCLGFTLLFAAPASALTLVPPKPDVLLGVSDRGSTEEFNSFVEVTGKHPALMETFLGWGNSVNKAFERWRETQTRPIVAISTQNAQTLEEMHVLSLLRRKEAKSITITKKRGEIDAAEIEYRIPVEKLAPESQTVQRMLDQISYGELTQKKENGKLTSVTHKVRVKVMSNLDEHGRRLRVVFRSKKL